VAAASGPIGVPGQALGVEEHQAVRLPLRDLTPRHASPPPSCLPRSTGFGRSPRSWYFRAPRSAGLAVTALEEPEPTEGFMAEGSQEPFLREVPFHCVAEARKLRAPRPRGVGTVHAGRGAAWPAAALTSTNIHRGASWGESENSGTKMGAQASLTPARLSTRANIHTSRKLLSRPILRRGCREDVSGPIGPGVMRDAGCGLRRIALLRRTVNRGTKKGRGCYAPAPRARPAIERLLPQLPALR
jgi:hypothetical protein